MKSSQFRGRYFRILYFFAGVIVRFILWELLIAKLGLRKWTRRTRPERFRREAVRFRALAIHMGGVMIKVGQFLSSRLDVLPPEVTDELANLQDEVPAESYDSIGNWLRGNWARRSRKSSSGSMRVRLRRRRWVRSTAPGSGLRMRRMGSEMWW